MIKAILRTWELYEYIQYADHFCAKNHFKETYLLVRLCVHHAVISWHELWVQKKEIINDVANATAAVVFIPSLQWLFPHMMLWLWWQRLRFAYSLSGKQFNLLRGSSQNINPHILEVDVLEVDILGVRVDILGVDILRLTPVELGSYWPWISAECNCLHALSN